MIKPMVTDATAKIVHVGVMVIRVLSMDVGKLDEKQDIGNIVVVMITLVDLRPGHYKYYDL